MGILENPKVKTGLTVGLAVISIVVLVWVVANHTVLSEPSAESVSRKRVAIDSETRKVFVDYFVADGSTLPWKNPDTGKNTLVPAEFCFWTKDGKAKLEPTYVLLNEFIGKKEPTICPDCGRTVVMHNSLPPTNLMIEAGKLAGKIKDDAK